MESAYLYQQVAESIRQEILTGRVKPGDILPSVRQMRVRWNCTPGTIQRAYQELARQGLVVSRAGQGTRVAGTIPPAQGEAGIPLRRAALVNRSEAFLLENLTAGFALSEIEQAVELAMDRWRAMEQEPEAPIGTTVRFAGSHDMAITWIAAHFKEIAPGAIMQVSSIGSLGGLMALAEGKADIAGCHLWDEETDTYNLPFVRRLLPGKRVAMVNLAHRRIGWIVAPGNPKGIVGTEDLSVPGIRFVNRQSGSGTRVWLDAQLALHGIDPARIRGYEHEEMTHSAVARAVAEGQADVGLGLEAAAAAFGLGFVFLVREPYDLAIPAANSARSPVREIITWLATPAARQAIGTLRGYDVSSTGGVTWVG